MSREATTAERYEDMGNCEWRDSRTGQVYPAKGPTPATTLEDAYFLLYEGDWYSKTGKTGTRMDSGEHVEEYECEETAARLWASEEKTWED